MAIGAYDLTMVKLVSKEQQEKGRFLQSSFAAVYLGVSKKPKKDEIPTKKSWTLSPGASFSACMYSSGSLMLFLDMECFEWSTGLYWVLK